MFTADLLPIYIGQIGDGLKGVKADSKGEGQADDGKLQTCFCI